MPLKFLSVNQDDDVYNRILNKGKYSQTHRSNRNSVLINDNDKKNLMTEK